MMRDAIDRYKDATDRGLIQTKLGTEGYPPDLDTLVQGIDVNGKKVQLLRTGRIWGDIHATALTTEEGAFIDVKITMVSPQEPAPQPETEDNPASLGAVDDQPVDKPAESIDELTENISQGEEGELSVGGDWNEGQTNADHKDLPDDEVRQST